jgi:nitroimidazol reductase NimA-like FMN-containing flavoprotein (pyridoxamine 5'-phosphate oxidase superfamily)
MTTLWNVATSLEPSECLRLLRSARLGRIGMCTPAGPQVLPVNYRVLDGNILLRTDLYSAVAAGTKDATVAFEVDELDDRLDEGWSVLVVGRGEHVEGRAEVRALFDRLDSPWAPGSRPLVARIVPSEVTGRRFRRH